MPMNDVPAVTKFRAETPTRRGAAGLAYAALASAALLCGCATASSASRPHDDGGLVSDHGRTVTTTTVIHEGIGEGGRQTTTEAVVPARDDLAWGGTDIPVGTPTTDRPPPASGELAAGAAARRAPAAPPPLVLPPLPPPSGGMMVEGVASRYQVIAVFEDNRPALDACAARATASPAGPQPARDPTPGTVTLAFWLARDGSVRSATVQKSTYADPHVGQCVARVAAKLRVPDARGGVTDVIYPLHLGPPG
jgi:hypothetical protein